MKQSELHQIIKEEIIKSDLPEDLYVEHYLESAFPSRLRRDYGDKIRNHKLRREIIATQLSNGLVDEVGISFVQQFHIVTGKQIGRAHV